MEVTCSQCNTKLNVPDEKIPKGQTVRINCPKCKNKIVIDAPETVSQAPSPDDDYTETGKLHLKFIESQKGKEQGEDETGYDDVGEDSLDFYEEDTKLALVMVGDDIGEKTARSVEDLGYQCILCSDTRDALNKLRFHHFDVVLISDGFDGQELAASPIMNHMNHMAMSSRRRLFLALMSDKFRTMDDNMAYGMSSNIVINSSDIDKLTQIMKRGISEWEKFYKVFIDTLVEVGKA